MKKLFISLLAMAAISLCVNAQIELDSYGNITIRRMSTGYIMMDNSGYAGTPAIHSWNNNIDLGTSSNAVRKITAYSYQWISDKRQKENITDLDNALNIVMNLQGVKYDIKKEYTYNDSVSKNFKEKLDKKRKNQIGFLAQDVEKVLPEAVDYDDSTDIYGIDYARIIPVLVEAIKEQQIMIEALAKSKNTKKSTTLESDENAETSNNNILYQNAPNPFKNSTDIKYIVADNVQSAILNIYNMNGTQLKSIPILHRGNGTITINGSEFVAGMYFYALIVDGKIIDTKQMVLTE